MGKRATINNTHSWIASVLRGGLGLKVRFANQAQPAQPLELYEFETCPFCRKVREALSELDLEYISHPASTGSANRAQTPTRRGRKSYPYLVDPNTGRSMGESEDILDYLHETYGQGRERWRRALAPLNTASSAIVTAWRPFGGRVRRGLESREQQTQHLVLYNYEASPYCRKVRETLQALNLDCHVKNVAKASARRPELIGLGGKMQVPYLIDANTGAAMYESDVIVAYLRSTYGSPRAHSRPHTSGTQSVAKQ